MKKWFLDMKIGAKLVSGFIIVAIIAGAVGIVGVTSLKTAAKSDTELYENMTVPISHLGEIATSFQRIRVNVRDMILTSNPSEVKGNADKIAEREIEIDENLKEFEKTILSEDMRNLYTDLVNKKAEFSKQIAKVSILAQENKDEEAMALMSETGASGIASREFQDVIEKVVQEKVDDAKLKSDTNTAAASTAVNTMIIIIVGAVVIAILLGIFLSKIISTPMKLLSEAADKLALGDIDVNIQSKTKDEIGKLMGSFSKMVDNIKGQSEVAEMIASGDLSVAVIPKSEKDVLSKSLKLVVETLQKLVAEANMLTKAAVEGKLDTRGNVDGFKGGYKEIVLGVNKTLDSVIGPLNVAAEYVDRISKGDIPPKITDTYNGDFNEIKNNLNSCIENISELVVDANMLQIAAVEGRLDTRADATKHGGDYRRIVEGVNHTLDSVIGPLNVAAEYVDRISKGDIPPKITDSYNGDFNEIKNNLNTCIDAVNALVKDAEMLSKAAVEGRLDTRADASRHGGDFRNIVEGVNHTLDSVIGPLNVAAEYVDRISKGDIPPKITDTYNGDFNEIKNNLNLCIDSITLLVVDAANLVESAVNGKLSTRADASKHSGDYKKIVEGVNKTLDAVIEPVKEASAVLQEMSNGNLKVYVKGNYKGDHADIKNALNGTIDSLSSYVTEISEVLGEMSNSNLQLSINNEYKGDFAQIKDALNLIIKSFNEVFTEINNAADQVSSGSNQVSDGSQALSQGTTEQASSIEELTASITQVAAQTKQNAVNAGQASQLALNAKDGAVIGNSHMKEMLKSMEEINESSSSISKIIKVIDDIAFQTNILALNAAVEAARAGQHGKGFAVVAEEVRNLAARSANAAKETTDLIEGSIKKVEFGTKIANNTAESLDQIVTEVSKAATLVGEIAAASNEQSIAISQINKGIEQVSDVVQTNSATAEESAAASEELSSQASMLKSMVVKFRLKGSESRSNNEISLGDQMNKNYVKSKSIDYAEVTKKKPKISLSNMDFGKY